MAGEALAGGGRWSIAAGTLHHLTDCRLIVVLVRITGTGPCLFFAWGRARQVREACVLLIIASRAPPVYKDVKRELRAVVHPAKIPRPPQRGAAAK